MGLADLITAAGGTVVAPADEHPAVAPLERAIANLRRGQARAAVDNLSDAMTELQAAMDAIADNDDLMVEF